jgi:hypothetical protein
MFLLAMPLSFWSPYCAFALVCCVLLIYLRPRVPIRREH